MHDLRAAAEKTAGFPQVLLFAMASVEETEKFFASRWPEARVVADPERVFYDGFGRGRAGLGAFLSPRAICRYIQAMFKGNFVGRPVGSVMVMPGMFLVRDGEVVWEHEFKHVGDHPDLQALVMRWVPGTDRRR